MIDLATTLHAQACNNAVANHRLLKACARLSDTELAATRTSFFPSIIHTLNHILTVDWFYVSGIEGHCMGYTAFEPEIPCPRFADLDREQRAIDRRLMTACKGLTAAMLDEPVILVRPQSREEHDRVRVLLHLFEHQIHHRGQVHALLSGTSSAPPQLDEFFLDTESERRLRAADFEELGLTEAGIWQASRESTRER